MHELIDRARAGDRDALGALFRGHQHLLLRYYRGRGARSPEDLASQVWIDVATGLGRFQGDDVDFRRWLFTIARRRFVDDLRRDGRRPETIDADAGVDSVDPAAAAAFATKESLERALALVRRLPPDMAEAVLLRVVGDLDVADVALITGRSEGYVRVLVHRGLARLRSQLAVTPESSASMNTSS